MGGERAGAFEARSGKPRTQQAIRLAESLGAIAIEKLAFGGDRLALLELALTTVGMASHTHSSQVQRLEVVDTGRRRRWSEEEKLRIVAESLSGPRLVSATARRNGISTSLYVRGGVPIAEHVSACGRRVYAGGDRARHSALRAGIVRDGLRSCWRTGGV